MRVFIQRGHCFRRTGSTGTAGSGTTEQAYVNDIANRAAVLLRRAGHAVNVALADERVPSGYDVFVALHCDGSTSRSASGASIGFRTAAGDRVGEVWKRRYRARGWPYGFRGDNYTAALRLYYGTGWAATAGIGRAFVLEHGFLTNPTRDGQFLTSERGRTIAALALADTIEVLAGDGPIDTPDSEEDVMREGQSGTQAIGELQDTLNRWERHRGDPHPEWYGSEGLTRDKDYGAKTAAAVSYAKGKLGWPRDGSLAEPGFVARVEVDILRMQLAGHEHGEPEQ